jgi:hypothetical protein
MKGNRRKQRDKRKKGRGGESNKRKGEKERLVRG